ncbi:MAG: tripartite tricarboxylate transporter substrate binding protein [Burkholderiaceae bacterium]|nr:tripartite tricarboxylate transporter substrate binding protein [Pseudomonadota bacterium]MBS0596183.1 tripartite tricarboxylate transporter substrate binding protein [Pseudomonadota bacterium]MCO5115512.1 tripartite tricarboxylate transporter substrate binding protein [Burkholderiaceae bacterium]MCP5217993.1 tripartite tricarboxylate transporter substrate binding protein [Burkholderiaceae bacterium]
MAFAAWALAASAWAWADRPIRLIVPAPAGGTADTIARVVGQQLSTDIGQPVVVENKPGAAASIGLQAMLQAAPDGQTLAMVPSNVLTESPHVMKLPYDPLKDILPIATLVRSGVVLVTPASTPARDFASLVTYLKTRKGAYSTYSAGTASHYAGLILSDKAGLDMQHVGYAGSPPALLALMGGQVDFMFDGILTSLPMIKSGKLRAYAFSGKQRSRLLPDVPTTAEVGYPELQFMGWIGLVGSAKLPADVLAKVQAAVKKAASEPAVQKRLAELGEPDLSVDTPAIQREDTAVSERNAAIVKKYGIKSF